MAVEHVNFNDSLNHKVMLRELADNDRLKGIVVACVWDDGTITTGWSEMSTGQLALGALKLQQEALEESLDEN